MKHVAGAACSGGHSPRPAQALLPGQGPGPPLVPSSSTSPRASRSYRADFFSSAARDSLSRSVVV